MNTIPKYIQFEREWERVMGLDDRTVVSCNSGTAALHLALESLRLPPGTIVAVPDYTMVACARAVTLARLTPVFVDVTDDLTICPDALDLTFDRVGKTGRTIGAVMPVSVYGRPPSKDVWDVAKKYEAKVVEDLAEAHLLPVHPGTDAACWSFYKNKIIAGEEGGAVWVKDGLGRHLATSLKSVGFTPDHDYTHIPYGHNYRLADALASLILDSMNKREDNVAVRRATEFNLNQACPDAWKMPYRAAPWVYDVRIPGMKRGTQKIIIRTLQSQGIAARYGFVPLTQQEEYMFKTLSLSNPSALRAADEVFYLPLGDNGYGLEEAKRVFRIITNTLPAFLRPKG